MRDKVRAPRLAMPLHIDRSPIQHYPHHLMFGLDTDTVHRIRGCFAQFPQIHRVLLYGSRAIGTQHPGSDVDITLIGKNLSRKNILLPLSDALDELLLPVTFDCSIFIQLENPELIRHILERGVCFYEAKVKLRDGWKKQTVGKVASIINGGTPKSKIPEYWGGDINWITPADLGKLKTRIITSTPRTITKLGLDKSSAKLSPPGSVILSTRAPIGHLAISEISISTNQGCRTLVPSNSTNSEYLYYYLKSNVDALNTLGTGATFKELSTKSLSNFPIPVPPLPEQESIVATLDQAFAAIDQAKAKLERNIANAKELFQSKLNAIFSQKGEGWVETTLGDVIDVKHGFAFKSAFFSDSGEHVVLTPGNYYEEGGYRDRGAKQKYYNGEIPEGYVMEKGALLVAMTEQAAGLLGCPLLVPESGKFLHNQRLGLIQKTTSEPLDNRFLFHAFNTKRFRQYVHATGTGVKVRHTSPTKIKEAKLSLTFDPRQQEAVIETLDALKSKTDVLTETYRTKLSCLEDLKKSILEKAFSGHLTRSDSLLVG